jgi:hypothetical protein
MLSHERWAKKEKITRTGNSQITAEGLGKQTVADAKGSG